MKHFAVENKIFDLLLHFNWNLIYWQLYKIGRNYILYAIDFFRGGGGMTHGLIQAGIDVIAGVNL